MTGNIRERCPGRIPLPCFLHIAGCDRMRLR